MSGMRLNFAYTECIALHDVLKAAQVPHLFDRLFDGWQLIVLQDNKAAVSCVQHFGSYGHEANLIEMSGSMIPGSDENPVGGLSAADASKIILKWYGDHGGEIGDGPDGLASYWLGRWRQEHIRAQLLEGEMKCLQHRVEDLMQAIAKQQFEKEQLGKR